MEPEVDSRGLFGGEQVILPVVRPTKIVNPSEERNSRGLLQVGVIFLLSGLSGVSELEMWSRSPLPERYPPER